MIIELPKGRKSEIDIAEAANRYARNVIEDPEWLNGLDSQQVNNAFLMIYAHASGDLVDKALDKIGDFLSNQEKESKD